MRVGGLSVKYVFDFSRDPPSPRLRRTGRKSKGCHGNNCQGNGLAARERIDLKEWADMGSGRCGIKIMITIRIDSHLEILAKIGLAGRVRF
jgi:hypothetical protein